MSRLILSCIFVFSILISGYSQFTIQGVVKDEAGEKLEFASVQLLVDSQYCTSALSNAKGEFKMDVDKPGEGQLLTNLLGYSPNQKNINFHKDTFFEIILKVDSIELEEVSIVGLSELIETKADGLIVNLNNQFSKEGKETTDILKLLPAVNVSDQNVNIFGKTSAIVYINDRRVRLQGQALMGYLNSLPPEAMQSVEIITTPPAEYDAEGNVGIIKIQTNRNVHPGWKEYFKVGAIKNSYASYMLSAFVNYSSEKMFFEGTVSHGDYTYLNKNDYTNIYSSQEVNTYNPKSWNFQDLNTQATFGYNFNDRSNLIVDVQIPITGKQKVKDLENYTTFSSRFPNTVDSTMNTQGETNKDIKTYNGEIFFKHFFPGKKAYFTTSTAYLRNLSSSQRDFNSLIAFNEVYNYEEAYTTKGEQVYDILSSKLDFSFPIFGFQANSGAKASYISSTSNSSFDLLSLETNESERSIINEFAYEEFVQAAYFSLQRTLGSWSFKGGLRGEWTQTKGHSISLNQINEENYLNLFPSIHINKKFEKGSSLTFSYASRMERPPYSYLDPFRWYISKYDVAVGNPFLKPSNIQLFEFSYLNKYGLNTKLYYTDQKDQIGQYVVLDANNVLDQVQETDNFMDLKTFGLNMYKYLKPFTWLETVVQADLSYTDYQSNRLEFSDYIGFGGVFILNNTFDLNKNLKLNINFSDRLPGVYNYRKMENYFRLDAGITMVNNKKNLEIRLVANDIFKTASPNYYYESDGVRMNYNNYFDTRSLKVVAVWKPGNWFNQSQKISSSSNEEEKRRL